MFRGSLKQVSINELMRITIKVVGDTSKKTRDLTTSLRFRNYSATHYLTFGSKLKIYGPEIAGAQ